MVTVMAEMGTEVMAEMAEVATEVVATEVVATEVVAVAVQCKHKNHSKMWLFSHILLVDQ
jgi:hypothetical protein